MEAEWMGSVSNGLDISNLLPYPIHTGPFSLKYSQCQKKNGSRMGSVSNCLDICNLFPYPTHWWVFL